MSSRSRAGCFVRASSIRTRVERCQNSVPRASSNRRCHRLGRDDFSAAVTTARRRTPEAGVDGKRAVAVKGANQRQVHGGCAGPLEGLPRPDVAQPPKRIVVEDVAGRTAAECVHQGRRCGDADPLRQQVQRRLV
jgi:hypothetical protein